MKKNTLGEPPVLATPFAIAGQGDNGYRYSIEPFLLADFARLPANARVLDIGSGCGIISLLLLKRHPGLRLTGVEIQPELNRWALDNIKNHGLESEIEAIEGDIVQLAPTWEEGSFDAIVSNPPYRKINTGRTNPDRGKALARHEITLNLASLLAAAHRLLGPGGSLTLAYPPVRLQEVLAALAGRGLWPTRLRFIHGHPGAQARIFLVEAVKGPRADLQVEQPLTVYNPDRTYTREMEEIYASLDYSDRADDHGQKRRGAGAG